MIEIGPRLCDLIVQGFWAAVVIVVVIYLMGGFDKNE